MPANKPEAPKPAAVSSLPVTAPDAGEAPPLAPEPAPKKRPTGPSCAECGGPVRLYEGFNPHKVGQAWCLAENARRPFVE